MEYLKFTVTSGVAKRLDAFLAESDGNFSRNAAQKLIADGHVLVSGNAVKQNYKLTEGDVVEVAVPEPEPLNVLPEDIPLDVLYEDAHVLVINKPKGMVVHPAAGHFSGTLVNAVMHHAGNSLSGINGTLRPGIVHRIDKDTSGAIVVAKTDLAHKHLAAQLKDHTITRQYEAVVHNNIKDDFGTVDKPISRDRQNRKRMGIDANGRRAVTHFTVNERLGQYTHITAKLETGRTHQIRVHMASIGHPIVGDVVYGPAKDKFSLNGQALHARFLEFEHPETGQIMQFEAPLPEYFIKLLLKLKKL